MGFKVVNVFDLPGVDCGESLLAPLSAAIFKGMWKTEDDIITNTTDADAVICSATYQPFTQRVLASLTRCRIIASSGIGYNNLDLEAATECGIVVTNVPDASLDEVSGRAMAFMLALNHRLMWLDRAVREKQTCFVLDMSATKEYATPIYRMNKQTLGVIGFGKIGTATAIKARGMGMRVISYDPYVFDGVMTSHSVIPVNLDTLLKESDYISLHTPLTEETTNMISRQQFEKMKRTAYFINTARGGCVDEPALIYALQEGFIAGAGIDVTASEPIEADNQLLKMSNVILTGHSGGLSLSAAPEIFGKPMKQVVKALRGEWPTYAVNLEVQKRWLERWGQQNNVTGF